MARVGRSAGDDHLRLVLARQRLDLIHINPMRRPIDPIGDRLEPAAGHVDRRTMGEVPACREIKAHENVAGLHQSEEHALIGLAAGIGLDVGEAAVEQLARALDRQAFRDVDELAAAVIAPARIAFRVFVGHHRALRLEHGARHDVFRGDELDARRADDQAPVRLRGRSQDRRRRGLRRRTSSNGSMRGDGA